MAGAARTALGLVADDIKAAPNFKSNTQNRDLICS
jgi:hypothetical protein